MAYFAADQKPRGTIAKRPAGTYNGVRWPEGYCCRFYVNEQLWKTFHRLTLDQARGALLLQGASDADITLLPEEVPE